MNFLIVLAQKNSENDRNSSENMTSSIQLFDLLDSNDF